MSRKNISSILLDAQAWQDGLVPTAGKNEGKKTFTPPRTKIILMVLATLLLFGFLFVRLVQLQVLKGSTYQVLSDTNRVEVRLVPYERGIIYGKQGGVLAGNIPTFTATLMYSQIPRESEEVFEVWKSNVISFLQIEESALESALLHAQKTPFMELLLATGLSQDHSILFEIEREALQGISIQPDFIRDYKMGEQLAHVLGYTGEITQEELADVRRADYVMGEQVGKAGIEQSFQEVLRGTYGSRLLEVDSKGETIRVMSEESPRPGNAIFLTIDEQLQQKTFEVLQEALQTYEATSGAIIVQEVRTGKILALVSLPTYNNNLFARGIKATEYNDLLADPTQPLFNRAVAGRYPPGSTVKPFVGFAGLNEGIITATSRISDIPQVIEIGGGRFPDWRVAWGRGPVGFMTVKDAIAESSNIFFYKISGGYEDIPGLGIARLKEYFLNFGIGRKTGIDLSSEIDGVVPDAAWKLAVKNEGWYLGDDYQVGIGQGDLLVTPLQLVNAFTTLANSGTIYRPLLVEKVVDVEGKNIELFLPEVVRELSYPDEHFATIQQGLRQAVSTGIVFPLRNASVSVAAKTGTAEFGLQDERGIYETHAWLAGYAPFEDPEISFVVLLEKGGSSQNAAEVAKTVVDWYFGRSND